MKLIIEIEPRNIFELGSLKKNLRNSIQRIASKFKTKKFRMYEEEV